MIAAAQDALAKAGHAAGVATAAAAIGLAALVVGLVALMIATVAIVSRVIGEGLSLFAELVTGMIEAVVAMIPDILHAVIMAGAMAAMWVAFNWTWVAYSQDMPAWLAAALAGAFVVLPVGYALYRQLWPMVVVASATITLVGAALLYLGPIVRVGCIIGALGVLVTRDVMRGRAQSERV